ncbi:hypothetical protein [Deinococcus navajonensis]|uniref:HK97 gp10 family phage protein n=1 Tax=Deinococcus navajonensis TaxID=309884 RepID=A0ABV8XTU1_9DEIO
MAKINPAGLAKLRGALGQVALAGAEGAAEVLRDKLSGEGSGRQYSGLPNRSSSEREYPAEQSGALRDSIAAEPAEEARARFGPIKSPPVEAGYLHFSNAQEMALLHFRPPDMGGRPFMDDALHDRDIHKAALDAVEREASKLLGARVRVGRRS